MVETPDGGRAPRGSLAPISAGTEPRVEVIHFADPFC
jgi:hypothetical protein